MELAILLVVLFLVGILLMVMPARESAQKVVAGIGIVAALVLLIVIGQEIFSKAGVDGWLMEVKIPWIASWGINFHLGIDSLAYWLSVLTVVMGAFALFVATPKDSGKSYYSAIIFSVFSVVGLLFSVDVFLFFIFWELALLPVYWLLFLHGGPERISALWRFFILTQLSGLLLLASVLTLVYANFFSTGHLSFDYRALLEHSLSTDLQAYVFWGFLVAFLIKMPIFPFHGWLASVFSEAPAAIIMVGVLVKTAAFGLLRFSWPMFPEASLDFSVAIMGIGVFSIIYGAVLAFSQSESKRVLAYGTLSHAGMLLVGIFCRDRLAFFGVFLLVITQALIAGGLLMLLDRLDREQPATGNAEGIVWERGPKYSIMLLALLLASFGFPLFGTFIGEWWVLWSALMDQPIVAIIASLGIILSALYSLWLFQRIVIRKTTLAFSRDLSGVETMVYGALVAIILGFGLYPAPLLENINPPHLTTLNTLNEIHEASP